MHPVVETSIFAALIPMTVGGVVTAAGIRLSLRCSERMSRLAAGLLAAAGMALGLAAANVRLGLAAWLPDGALDYLLWVPPSVGFVAAVASLYDARRATSISLKLVIACIAAWLLTPDWESLGMRRWWWMAAMAAAAACVWLAGTGSLDRRRWIPPLLLALGCAGEGMLLALTGNMRLGDFATVGAAMAGVAVVVLLIGRSEPVRPRALAAATVLVAADSVLLAALAVFGAILNYSEIPDVVFFAPLLLPLGAAVPAFSRKS